jgi:hypothetical protein
MATLLPGSARTAKVMRRARGFLVVAFSFMLRSSAVSEHSNCARFMLHAVIVAKSMRWRGRVVKWKPVRQQRGEIVAIWSPAMTRYSMHC